MVTVSAQKREEKERREKGSLVCKRRQAVFKASLRSLALRFFCCRGGRHIRSTNSGNPYIWGTEHPVESGRLTTNDGVVKWVSLQGEVFMDGSITVGMSVQIL
jgi:hypothetical protein